MGFPILVRCHLYIESGPRWLYHMVYLIHVLYVFTISDISRRWSHFDYLILTMYMYWVVIHIKIKLSFITF